MKGLINYLKEVRLELFKVTWPKKDEIIKLTIVVFIISIVVALYLSGLDLFFTKLLESFISK